MAIAAYREKCRLREKEVQTAEKREVKAKEEAEKSYFAVKAS